MPGCSPTIFPTQAAGPGGILVPGELVGTAQGSGPGVDEVYVSAGRPLTAADDGRPVVVLEQGFARQDHLPDAGTLRVSGGAAVWYTGVGYTLTGASILAALLLGLGTVTIAPLFTLCRLRRMDIPSTLRLVE